MRNKINVAGIELDNYSMRESVIQVERSMGNSALFAVEEVTMDTLLEAKKDEKVQKVLEQIAHTVIADKEILEAVGEENAFRKHEIEHHAFFNELMNRMSHQRKKLFLIGEDEDEVERVCEFLVREFPDCRLEDAAALGAYEGTMESIVNDINALDPDVVVSILPSPKQEHFLLENKGMLSARLWYGMDTASLTGGHHNLGAFLRRHLYRRQLKDHILNYHKEEEV